MGSPTTAYAGLLRVHQRKLERQQQMLAVAITACLTLIVLVAGTVVVPTENSATSSPASNLIPGGITNDPNNAARNLLSAREDAFIGSVFDYFNIDDKSLVTLTKTTIDVEREDYSVVTRRATGSLSESHHSHRGIQFYDAPLNDLLPRNDAKITAFVGEAQSKTDQDITGMDGRWFAILPDSGNIVIKKLSDGLLKTRVFRTTSTLQPNGTTDFIAEIESRNGSLIESPEISLAIPDNTRFESVTPPEGFKLQTITESTGSFRSINDSAIGGNKTVWLPFSVRAANNSDTGDICPKLQVTGTAHSALFSDTQCVSFNTSSTEAAPSCTKQPSGTYQMLGSYSQLQDTPCIEAFKNSLRLSLAGHADNGSINVSLKQQNLGSNATNTVTKLDLSDALEYTGLARTDNQATYAPTDNLQWDMEKLDPLQSNEQSFRLSLKQPISSSPVAATDSYSYDGVLMLHADSSVLRVPVDLPYSKSIEAISLQSPIVSPGVTITILSIMIVFLTINYRHQSSAISHTKHGRADVNGQRK